MEDWCSALNTFGVSKKEAKEQKKQEKGVRGGLVGNCEDVAFVEVFFCVKRHIIIFKEEVGMVVIDASTCEFDNGFLLCPKTGEGDLRIWS